MRHTALKISLAVTVCAVALLAGMFWPRVRTAFGDDTVSFQDVEESLTCQCGCGLTVHSCNHLQCGSAGPIREEIRAQMALGKSKGQILSYFKGKYGEKILSAPTTTGFNVVAWIAPFALVLLGGAIVGITILRWSGRTPPTPPGTDAPANRTASPYDKILEKELKDFEG